MNFLKKIFKWFFGFGAKYRKREEEYHRRSKKFGNAGEFAGMFIYAIIPLLSLWGLFKAPFDGGWWVLKLFCGLGSIFVYVSVSELIITAVVALRHSMRMKIQNKIEGAAIGKMAEAIAGEKQSEEDKEKVANYEARGTNHKYDKAVGITGIVLAAVTVIAFVTMLYIFLAELYWAAI